jgi:hypothetical protein
MSTRNISLGVKATGSDNFATFMWRISRNPGSLNLQEFLEPVQPVQGMLDMYLDLLFMTSHSCVRNCEKFFSLSFMMAKRLQKEKASLKETNEKGRQVLSCVCSMQHSARTRSKNT